MGTQRKTGGRAELDALWTQVNALVADATAIRTALLLAMDVGNTKLLGLDDITATVTDLGALRAAILAHVARYENEAKANPGLADGTTDGKIQNANAISFAIDGALYTKAATDDLWDLSGETDTAADKYRAYWLYLDSSGTATVADGTDEDSEADAIAALPALAASKSVAGVYVAGLSCDFDGAAGLAAQGTIVDGWPAALSDPSAVTTSATVGIADGSTAGAIQTLSDVVYSIAGRIYRKAQADDLWDLSGETDTAALKYRAYRLYLDASGTASFEAQDGDDSDSAATALTALAATAETATKCPVGIFVAGPETDFDDPGGLDAQGDYYNGRESGLSDPAALTSSTTTLIHA